MRNKNRLDYFDILIIIGLVFLPIALIWKFINFPQPIGLYNTIETFVSLALSGFGGLGIGLMLAESYCKLKRGVKE